MNRYGSYVRLLVTGLVLSTSAKAQTPPMKLDDALARARQRAPQIIATQGQIAEAQGRLLGASVLLQENPVMAGSVGPRRSAVHNTTDFDIEVSQSFELGGRRAARIAGARAGVERETANSSDVLRRLLRDVRAAFARGLAAQERQRLAGAAEEVAEELLSSMQRRYEAGDVPVLDVNLARSGAARTRAEGRTAEARYISALGDLRVLLGMTTEEPLTIVGDLRDRKHYELEMLLAGAPQRADLRVLTAEIREAEAQTRLGKGMASPTVAPGFTFKRDSGDNVYQGGLTFTLPVFNHGQELRAVGVARAARLTRELEFSTSAVAVEVRTAFEVYRSHLAAVEELEQNALPSIDENEKLARRSFEEGEIGLAELLLIRRESFETRITYTERLWDAAIAGIELEARAGVLQ
jgi:outer membrane protein, heavy metal efflux system